MLAYILVSYSAIRCQIYSNFFNQFKTENLGLKKNHFERALCPRFWLFKKPASSLVDTSIYAYVYTSISSVEFSLSQWEQRNLIEDESGRCTSTRTYNECVQVCVCTRVCGVEIEGAWACWSLHVSSSCPCNPSFFSFISSSVVR